MGPQLRFAGVMAFMLAIPGEAQAQQSRQIVVAEDGARRPVQWENVPITTDAMVRFTSAWGEATPANRWCWTAIVRSGRVEQVVRSGAAAIPADGYALTGHGRAATWIKRHLPQGARVRLEPAPAFDERRTEREVDAIDPPRSLPAGGRQTNQLVVFTPKRGATTGTNIFGREAVVAGGRITAITGGNSTIPDNGFVLSGHGRGSAWIASECAVGDRVELNGASLTIIRDRESAFARVASALQISRKHIADCPGDTPGRLRAASLLAAAETRLGRAKALADAEPEKAVRLLSEAERLGWRAAAAVAPTKDVELRGVWIGSNGRLRGKQALARFFANLTSANINALFPQAAGFLGDDGNRDAEAAFRTFLKLAHGAGIEVHLWTWLPAHAVPRKRDNVLLKSHPDWADCGRNGKPLPQLDPAHPQARAALAAEAVRIITRFPVDGLQLDWEGTKGGYSERSMAQFRQKHGYDPRKKSGPKAAQALYKWRTELIKALVREIVEAARRARPEITISAALQCFNLDPAPEMDPGASHQWYSWVDDGLLDMICPMVYAQQTEFVDRTVRQIQARIKVRHCPGLILYPETARGGLISPYELLDQIAAVRKHGVQGVVLFSYLQLWEAPWAPDDRLLLTLREGPFRDRSRLPWGAARH
ncbi:MAG: family 10 glycosylhydrolase [Kiritimatiellaeota bacterium]|nr:family 10 glycosylhydrolase [Kiritimatiellota bacterium]